MNKLFRDASLVLMRVEGRHVRVALAVLSLVLFVIGAGAPGDEGGPGPGG